MTRRLEMLDDTADHSVATSDELDDYRLHRRFDRMGRLVGDSTMKRLMDAHVAVIGLGGVGSFAAEGLARSGVGRLSIVDFDDICITNTNRQLHAMQGCIGKKKADVMADRLRRINPRADVVAYPVGYEESRAAEILQDRPDYVVDAIDHLTAKCHLLAHCREHGIPIVTATGSGGRMDPTQIAVDDLATTTQDPLARKVRRILRTEYAFPREGKPFGIPAVYSREPHRAPRDLRYDNGDGFRCVCPQGDNGFFTCDARNVIHGNASFVTGAFGLTCASIVVRHFETN